MSMVNELCTNNKEWSGKKKESGRLLFMCVYREKMEIKRKAIV